MFHPFDSERPARARHTLAVMRLETAFRGKPSHAAIAPWDGQSALTACLQTFHLVDSQRVHFRDGVRVHGYIEDGGQAVNIIPERAVCEFSVRATDLAELARVRGIVERCARGAALACGAEVELLPRPGYKDLVTNLTDGAEVRRAPAGARPEPVGEGTPRGDRVDGHGGRVDAVPSIHAWIAICGKDEATCSLSGPSRRTRGAISAHSSDAGGGEGDGADGGGPRQ